MWVRKGAVSMREGNTPTERRPTARQRIAAARREQILKTALKLFAAQGFDATSTRQIAKEVGVAEGLIFHYFPTKASLLTAILEDRLEGRRAFRTRLRPLLEGADPRGHGTAHRLPRLPRRGRGAQGGPTARDGGDDVRLLAGDLLPRSPPTPRPRVARTKRSLRA